MNTSMKEMTMELLLRYGFQVLGAIVNKVDLGSQPGIAAVLERGLARPESFVV